MPAPAKDAAAMTQLDPDFIFELAIGGACGVGVDAEAAGKIARAGQAVAGWKFATENAEDNLRDELLTQGNLAGAVEPEAHLPSF